MPPPDEIPRHVAFPVALVTTGRKLLIVGGGHETEDRLRQALRFDWAKITLITLESRGKIPEISASDPRVHLIVRPVTEADVADADIVIEGCGVPATVDQLRQWSTKHHKPLNAMDLPPACDFYCTSFFARGPLLVSVSSGGFAPAIAAVFRRWLEEMTGRGWQTAACLMAAARLRLPSGKPRMELMKSIARNPQFRQAVDDDNADLMREILAGGTTSAPAASDLSRVARDVPSGLVALVGCPADAGLLTARAAAYLQQADIVFHDRLLPDSVLEKIRSKCVPVGKEGHGHSTPQEEIHALILQHAEAGKLVVRLHGGDPGIYGRLGDELAFLSAHGIRCDVVPGVSAVQIAAARAHAPLTHRGRNHRITLISGHCMNDAPPEEVPGPALGNIAVYMGVHGRARLRTLLQEAGWPDDVPVIIGERLGGPDERIIHATIANFATRDVHSPAVFLIGSDAAPTLPHTLVIGGHPDRFLRHGPLLHWPSASPGSTVPPIPNILLATSRDAEAFFTAHPEERNNPARRWLAGDSATLTWLKSQGLTV